MGVIIILYTYIQCLFRISLMKCPSITMTKPEVYGQNQTIIIMTKLKKSVNKTRPISQNSKNMNLIQDEVRPGNPQVQSDVLGEPESQIKVRKIVQHV